MLRKIFVGCLAFFIPPLAFLYLSRGWLALIYLLVLIVTAVVDFYVQRYFGLGGLGLLLAIVATVHALRIAQSETNVVKHKFYNYWWGALTIPLAVALLSFAARSFLYEPFSIPSESMSPTLMPGDYILVKKSGYGNYGTWGVSLFRSDNPNNKPKSGEIVALYPPGETRIYIERIIGIPGDEVRLDGANLTINGEIVSKKVEAGLFSESIGEQYYIVKYLGPPFRYRNYEVSVPPRHYFVMGDNRNNSSDSRLWGMVPEANMVGKVVRHW